MTEAELTRLADLVADRLADRLLPVLAERDTGGLVDAAELARILGVSRSVVYANAERFGAVRVGTGSRPRLRFDPDRARDALDLAAEPEPERAVPRRRARSAPAVPLLPIGGRDA